MKRKLYLSIIFICTLCLSGCMNNNSTVNNAKGNCSATECIKMIKPENTVEEINDIIGFEGELTDEKYNIYYWELSEDSGIKVSYYSSSKGTIVVDMDRDLLKNKNVNFSRYNELKEKINNGISYKNFITYIGNVEGSLIEKSSISNKYIWVANDSSYLIGTFSNRTGNCTFASGMIK